MLEGVLEIGEEGGLVEKLGGSEMRELAAQCLLGHLGERLQERERHLRADDRGALKETLLVGRQPVDAGGENGLDGGRDLNGGGRVREAIGAGITQKNLGLDQRPDALLKEERIAVGTGDEDPLEWFELGTRTQERVEQLRGAVRRKRV